MKKEKIGVAMSGGVDSTTTAALLLEQGFEVHGYFLRLPLPGLDQQEAQLRALTRQLDIPLHQLDLRDFFSSTVIRYFIETYQRGWTPNPCVFCNREVKFGKLLSAMLADGMDKAATGHYAEIREVHGVPRLCRAVDPSKDQSYFLCRLSEEQLRHVTLPLGRMLKKDVYKLALQFGFTDFEGKESQDICFLGGKSIAEFFREQHIKETPGEIVTTDGRVLSTHQGLWRYTIGQRRGLGLPDATPWYVGELDGANNRVIVCKKEQLFADALELIDVQASRDFSLPWRGLIQLRSRHVPTPALVVANQRGGWSVIFVEKQRAITPGQYAALYEGDMIVGSGVIA